MTTAEKADFLNRAALSVEQRMPEGFRFLLVTVEGDLPAANGGDFTTNLLLWDVPGLLRETADRIDRKLGRMK